MTTSFINFFRNGRELHTSKLNGFRFVSFGRPTGKIANAVCFESVVIDCGGKRQRTVTQADMDGPVSIALVTKGQPLQWFALADASTVEAVNAEKACLAR